MLFGRKKNIETVLSLSQNSSMKKTLGVFQLFLMGIGAILGTGIFVITGVAAAKFSGPAVTMAYLLAGFACIFIALAYTEVASMIPSSGGLYTYSYVALGEGFAWITGWMVSLYLMSSACAVAAGWSGYVVTILHDMGIILPKAISAIPRDGGIINLPAVLIVLAVTFMLVKGTEESTTLNAVLVFVKVGAIALFAIIAIPYFNIDNLFNNNVPYDSALDGSSSFNPFGYQGILAGAGLLFFGYNGFDTLASAAEEAKNPERDLSVAIISALVFCMVIYVLVSGLLVGLVPYNELGNDSPFAYALNKIGSNLGSAIVSTGAVAGMSTVIMMQLYAQSRFFFGMSRDGLLPKKFSDIHPKFGTPAFSQIVIGIIVAIFSAVAPLDVLGSLSSMTALFGYTLVSIIILLLRKRMPEIKRSFKCPAVYVVAPIAALISGLLMFELFAQAGVYFLAWLALGIVVYVGYARKHSLMQD